MNRAPVGTPAALPWLTLTVFAVTSLVTAAMLAYPQIGKALERDPAMLRGEWWRFVTTWLALTDGWVQIAVNSAALLIFGTMVEQHAGRLWWSLAYGAAGLAGEIAGIFWQPVGGGNSVAIAGLIGLFSLWQVRRKRLPMVARYGSTAVWLTIGLWLTVRADIHGPALLAGFAVGAGFLLTGDRTRTDR